MAPRKLHSLYWSLCLLLLFNSSASLETRQTSEVYYISPAVTYLRKSPELASPIVTAIYRGERVTILSRTQDNWCQVKTAQGEQVGWIQRALLSSTAIQLEDPVQSPGKGAAGIDPSLQPAPKQDFFVSTENLALHLLPLDSSQVVKVLKFKDKVEKVSESGSDWLKVEDPGTGVQGWTLASYLTESPPKAPKPVITENNDAPEKPSPPKPKKSHIGHPEEVDPEVM